MTSPSSSDRRPLSNAGGRLAPKDSERTEEKQLCVSCAAPNEPDADFCAKCGAPLSSYASTGPFEQVLAAGAGYRQAANRPRSLVVLLGVWVIFGTTTFGSLGLLGLGLQGGLPFVILGAGLLALSLIMIWKTTYNYLSHRRISEQEDT